MPKKIAKYATVFCPIKNAYGLVTIEPYNRADTITNFQYFEDENAKDIVNDIDSLPSASPNLLPDEISRSRTPMCSDKKRCCKVDRNGRLSFQCLYCSQLQIPSSNKMPVMRVFFLLDQSGSMSESDKKCAVNAVNNVLREFEGIKHHYYLVGWANSAKYYISDSVGLDDATRGAYAYLHTYENDYGTDAAYALGFITREASRCQEPCLVFFITDGEFDTYAAREARDELIRKCKNIEIIAIGVGNAHKDGLNSVATLKDLSKLSSFSNLGKDMQDIASVIKKKGGINL